MDEHLFERGMEPDKTFQWTLVILVVGIMVTGASLYIASTCVPEWTDPERAEQLSVAYLPKDGWFAAMDAVRTSKWPLYNTGTVLLALGTSVCIAVLLLGLRSWRSVILLRTPQYRWTVVALFAVSWIGYTVSLVIYVVEMTQRLETYGDAIGIPLRSIQSLFVTGCFAFAPIVLATALLSRPAVSLWLWPRQVRLWCWLTTVVAVLFVLFGLGTLLEALRSGPFIVVPVALVWIYTALILRAAAVSGFRTA